MQESVVESVCALIAGTLGVDRKHVTPTTDLQHDLGADSLDKFEVAMELEERFGVDIQDTDALSIKTVKDAARLVEPPSESQGGVR